MVTRQQIQVSARKLNGASWHHQGRSLQGGIDCIGGVIFIGLDTGIFTPEQVAEFDILDYSRRADAFETLIVKLKQQMDEIPIEDAIEGDVLTFRMAGERTTSHVGTLVRGTREMMLVHSLESRATLEEPLRRWEKFITHAFRFRGIEE